MPKDPKLFGKATADGNVAKYDPDAAPARDLRWLRDKLKWPSFGLSVVMPVAFYLTITTYVRMYENTLIDETPWMIRRGLLLGVITTFVVGLIGIPRWYSFVAFGSILVFIFVGMTSFP
jgi:hypothetical protein